MSGVSSVIGFTNNNINSVYYENLSEMFISYFFYFSSSILNELLLYGHKMVNYYYSGCNCQTIYISFRSNSTSLTGIYFVCSSPAFALNASNVKVFYN